MLPETIPRLESSLVTLRGFKLRDDELVASVADDPLIPLITTVPTTATGSDVRAYIDRQHERLTSGSGYSFAVTDPATDDAVGQIGLWTSDIAAGRATTGYWIAPQHRRRGYGRAALSTLTEWALTLPEVERLQLHVEPWNEASCRIAEQCGYQREGLLRSWQRVGGERKDMYVYSVVPERHSPTP